MNDDRIRELTDVYRDGLLNDTLPFWIEHAVDREFGGFSFCLDRDGTVFDTDKGMWQQGRFTWLLSTLYRDVEPREEWKKLARHGVDFLLRHGFDDDGRMFFQVTRDGSPVRKRRYIFTETFAIIALAAWAEISGDEQAKERAESLFELVDRYLTEPGLIPPKKDPSTRDGKGLVVPMIMLSTAQVLRRVSDHPLCTSWVERAIDEIERDFMKPDLRAVMEVVGPHGEVIDHADERTLNPGHSIEAAWFLLEEARLRGGDARLERMGTSILDWMWERGWDREFGGILYFVDALGKPVQEYWHDMKFWWPHNETVLATLYAYEATRDSKYEEWHRLVHDWAHEHFPDREHGEWFGYLARDGRATSSVKGNIWKGPFHLPRMQLFAWKLLERLADSRRVGTA